MGEPEKTADALGRTRSGGKRKLEEDAVDGTVSNLTLSPDDVKTSFSPISSRKREGGLGVSV
jgi:hypothetical protein